MKIIAVLIFTTTTLLFACSKRTTTPIISSQAKSVKWGYEYYPLIQDSLNISFVSPGMATDKNCFPSDYFDSTKIDFVKISVFNRWGQVYFTTQNADSSWICNDVNNNHIEPGSYLISLDYIIKSDIVDTVHSHHSRIYIIESID
jgi:hypothetical protein